VTEQTAASGHGISCFAAVWFDANGDRRPDVLAINEFGRNALLVNRGDNTFAESDVDPVFGGLSMGVTTGDFDNDGHTDVYIANMYSKAGNRILANVDTTGYPPELFRKIVEATVGSKLYRSRGDGTFELMPPDVIPYDVGWPTDRTSAISTEMVGWTCTPRPDSGRSSAASPMGDGVCGRLS